MVSFYSGYSLLTIKFKGKSRKIERITHRATKLLKSVLGKANEKHQKGKQCLKATATDEVISEMAEQINILKNIIQSGTIRNRFNRLLYSGLGQSSLILV